MAEILLFNIEKSKAIKIKMLCRKFFMEAKEVSKEDFGCTISYLLGMSDDRGGAEHADFSEEMLYFAGFERGIFGISRHLRHLPRSAQTAKGKRRPQGGANRSQREFHGV